MNGKEIMEKKHLLLTIEYDGTCFSGWQRQPGRRTVQGELERVLSVLCGKAISIDGTGRTDAGVHALGQCATFSAEFGIPVDRLMRAANDMLAESRLKGGDVRITSVREVEEGFHARFSAARKTYRYCISRAPVLSPFDAGLAWHRPLAWSTDILEQAVRLFLGTHDFTAFAALRGNEPRPIPADYFLRTITQAQVVQEGEHVFITLTGTGFLYKMVRLMAGAAHEAARGKITLDELARLINYPRPDDKSPFCAPPDGLTLMQVHYAEEAPGNKQE